MGLNLAILSRNTKLYSTRRLVEAARARGHTVRTLDPLRCYMRIANDKLATDALPEATAAAACSW